MKCYICRQYDVDWSIEIDESFITSGTKIFLVPHYQCLCHFCGGNGIFNTDVEFTNKVLHHTFTEYFKYVRENL